MFIEFKENTNCAAFQKTQFIQILEKNVQDFAETVNGDFFKNEMKI